MSASTRYVFPDPHPSCKTLVLGRGLNAWSRTSLSPTVVATVTSGMASSCAVSSPLAFRYKTPKPGQELAQTRPLSHSAFPSLLSACTTFGFHALQLMKVDATTADRRGSVCRRTKARWGFRCVGGWVPEGAGTPWQSTGRMAWVFFLRLEGVSGKVVIS